MGARRGPRSFDAVVLGAWHVLRANQLWAPYPANDPDVPAEALVDALVALYSAVYSAPPASVRSAAAHRVEAMDLSDRWVAAGCRSDDPLLAAERRALVASHAALLDAVNRPGNSRRPERPANGQEPPMTSEQRPGRVLQMRLVVEAADYDEAVRFYRDVLGASEELRIHGDTGEKVTILDVGRATLEISNPAQVEMIDSVEVGRRVSPHLRVAFEVADAEAVTDDLVGARASLVAPPTVTPWRSLNARLEAPGDLQVTVFQELAGS